MPKSIEVKLEIPSDLVELLKPRRIESELKLLAALELYREGRVSLGKAAEIAGLTISEFLYELRSRGIPLNYDLEELKEDLKTVEEILASKEE